MTSFVDGVKPNKILSQSFQLIALTNDIPTIPAFQYDEQSGYYIIPGNPASVIKTTRGAKPLKSNSSLQGDQAETVHND